MTLITNIILAVVGFGAIILEFFVPAAGIIGILGGGCVITATVFTYLNYGLIPGTLFLFSCLVIGPVIFILYFKLFPKSFVGKRLILHNTLENESSADELIGQSGISLTPLRPVGEILINKKRYNGLTSGEFISTDTTVVVVAVEGNKIIVKPEDQL